MRRVAIVGAGCMGSQLAVFIATHHTAYVDIVTCTQPADAVSIKILHLLNKGRHDPDAVLPRIFVTSSFERLRDADLIIESVIEDRGAKSDIIRKIAGLMSSRAFLATNTSSLSPSELFGGLECRARSFGLHFFNPVYAIPLVEIVKTTNTTTETLRFATDFVYSLGKEGVVVHDSPGFIVNRLLLPMLNEAAFMIDEGVASAEDIDKAMRLGCNHPLGPCQLTDLIGIDVVHSIITQLQAALGGKKPANTLCSKLSNGQLGRKTKIGFYNYT
jgi:3-hydroxybutyryl-CoA dehydrogenase